MSDKQCEFYDDGGHSWPSECTAKRRIVHLESELAYTKESESIYAASLARRQEALKKADALCAVLQSKVKSRDDLLAKIAEATGTLDDDGTCPVCKAKRHAQWCWFPALYEWDKLQSLAAKFEAKQAENTSAGE